MARSTTTKRKSNASVRAITKSAKVEAQDTPRRSSRVHQSSRAKSKYFENENENGDENDEAYSDPSEEEFKVQSSFEDDDEADVPSKEDSLSDLSDSESDTGKNKSKKANKTTTPPSKKSRAKRSSVSTLEDSTIRDGNPIIHVKTLEFLKKLKKNNDRDWFHANNITFKIAENNFKQFVEKLGEEISGKDPTVPELPLKDLLFRIYRDIRFSNDQTPYKTYFSIAWSRTGRKGPYAHYYLSIQPGQSFAGGGIWQPEAQPLALLRQDIIQNPKRLKRILTRDMLFHEFLGEEVPEIEPKKSTKTGKANPAGGPAGSKEREEVAIRNFIVRNSENALKTAPKGISKDHKDIALLRLRNFTIGKRLSDEEICEPDAVEKLAEIFGRMTPFITYLNDVVMFDSNAPSTNETSSDDENVEEDE